MPGLGDYELERTPGGPLEPKKSPTPWIVAGLLLVAAVVAIWFAFSRREALAPAPTSQAASTPTPPPPPAAAPPVATDLPPLDESDALVRELVRKLSSNPQVLAWLATDGLIRNFVVVVSNTADGVSPSAQLRALKPAATFRALDQGGQLSIDPRSYTRYDALATALASLDPAASARLYATLKPRIDEAYRDLGFPNTPFDRTLERAIVMLLDTPAITDPVQLVEGGATSYAFADPDLETLPGARRQLLRMGPRNVASVKASLRALAAALGIPANRLPAAP